jgi:hypothetical protein
MRILGRAKATRALQYTQPCQRRAACAARAAGYRLGLEAGEHATPRLRDPDIEANPEWSSESDTMSFYRLDGKPLLQEGTFARRSLGAWTV